VVTGYGHEAGKALAEHPGGEQDHLHGIDRGGQANRAVVPGHSQAGHARVWAANPPASFFADANLDQVGLGAALAVFFNSGQICFAATRLLIEQSGLRQGRRRGRR